jgi:hypothetical protein
MKLNEAGRLFIHKRLREMYESDMKLNEAENHSGSYL